MINLHFICHYFVPVFIWSFLKKLTRAFWFAVWETGENHHFFLKFPFVSFEFALCIEKLFLLFCTLFAFIYIFTWEKYKLFVELLADFFLSHSVLICVCYYRKFMNAFFQERRRRLNENCALEHPHIRCNFSDN